MITFSGFTLSLQMREREREREQNKPGPIENKITNQISHGLRDDLAWNTKYKALQFTITSKFCQRI